MAWQGTYSRPGNAFGILPNSQFYGPQGHRGQDYVGLGAGATIYSYEHGVVALTGFSSIIGYYIVVRFDDGLYAGWAHVIGSSRVGVGVEVWPGSGIARVAGSGDNPGSAWAGAHIHTTLGPTATSIWGGTVYNPAPRIAAATGNSGTAGSGSTPLENDMTPEESAMLRNVHDAIFNGGPSMEDANRSISRSLNILQQTAGHIDGIVSRKVQRGDQNIEQIQDNADTNTMVRRLLDQPAGAVDVDKLAAAIVAKLPALPGVPTADQIAVAVAALLPKTTAADVADEIATRLDS